jgi:gliding motility-associated-like protein
MKLLLTICITFLTYVCEAQLNDSIIINKYSPVLKLDICKNQITVEDGTAFNVGDTVLMIQMKGAVVDSTNTSAFGSVLDYRNAGNYEFNYVKSKTGHIIELKNVLTRQYNIPDGKVQLVRVPYYQNVTFSSTLTCLPWDGSKGGILALNVAGTLRLNRNIDITGKGFWGGQVKNTNLNATNCFQSNFFYPTPSNLAAPKGESIASLDINKTSGKGSLASAGGGGNDHNSGGGGGGNGTTGGFGGYQLFECNNSIFDNRGIGGKGLTYNNTFNKIFLGGGGGAGHCNNGFLAPAVNTNYNGGRGGGIAIITADIVEGNNNSLIAKGDSAYEINSNADYTHDGMGGGGAGGTVLLSANTFANAFTINVSGGKGGDMHATLAGGRIGPGGGGSGGVVWLKQSSLPSGITIVNGGGKSGVLLQGNNNAHGATDGVAGLNIFNLNIPVSIAPFKPNIDSVRINFNPPVCNTYEFNGLAFTNTVAVNNWQWFFGNAGSSSNQNTTFTFANTGVHDVKLIATDLNGCKDSFAITITTVTPPPQPSTTVTHPTCSTPSGNITINTPIGNNLEYSIDGTNFQNNPAFNGLAAGTYNIVARNKLNGCISAASSATINSQSGAPPIPQAAVTKQPDCTNATGTITVTSPLGSNYEYSSNGIIYQSNSVFTYLQPGNYSLTVRNTLTGCVAGSTVITVNPIPANPVQPIIGSTIQPGCTTGTGSITIASPVGPDLLYSLNGGNGQSSPTFSTLSPGTYSLTVSNNNTGCISSATSVVINNAPITPPLPEAAVTTQPTCTISSGTITFTSPAGNNYEYSVNGTLFQSSMIFSNLLPSTYNVLVRDKTSGCNSQTLPLIIEPDVSATGSYFMPNAFTPNNDGLNDCFGIKNWGVITELQFLIYNRWGELVFSTSNPKDCWDGNYKGQPSILGNYVFYITASTLCGKVKRNGNLTLIR